MFARQKIDGIYRHPTHSLPLLPSPDVVSPSSPFPSLSLPSSPHHPPLPCPPVPSASASPPGPPLSHANHKNPLKCKYSPIDLELRPDARLHTAVLEELAFRSRFSFEAFRQVPRF